MASVPSFNVIFEIIFVIEPLTLEAQADALWLVPAFRVEKRRADVIDSDLFFFFLIGHVVDVSGDPRSRPSLLLSLNDDLDRRTVVFIDT